MTLDLRAEVLRAHGAGPAETAELLAYAGAPIAAPDAAVPDAWPLDDEPCVADWERYAQAAAGRGVVDELRDRLVQLRFPIAEGVSESDAYRAATRRGVFPADAPAGAPLVAPERVRLFVHPTAAGRLPVIVAGAREDFVTLIRALTRKNEPSPVPDSMGACIVGGYNNWDRVRALRAAWEAENPGAGEAEWAARFRDLVPHKALYQDRFVILSGGPYSAVPAGEAGMDEEAWRERSLVLRLEHECAHYFTRRVFGSMRNSLHDEVVADFAGMVSALGEYRAELFLRFLGVDGDGRVRPGGRLENYRGDPVLSGGAFAVLGSLVRAAAATLERGFAAGLFPWGTLEERARTLVSLSRLTVEEMAAEGALERAEPALV